VIVVAVMPGADAVSALVLDELGLELLELQAAASRATAAIPATAARLDLCGFLM
jgi:hypothetical protein